MTHLGSDLLGVKRGSKSIRQNHLNGTVFAAIVLSHFDVGNL